MKPTLPAAAALLCALCASTPSMAGPCTGVKKATIEDAMDNVRNSCAPNKVGICLGAIDLYNPSGNGVLGDAKCYGTRDPSGQPVNRQTLFQIGSITKVFTTTLLALRANQGRVSLDDNIGKYIPFVSTGYLLPDSRQRTGLNDITLRMLADYHSGLEKEWFPGGDADVAAENQGLRDCVEDSSCWSTFGDYRYSNFGVNLVANALQAADNQPWQSDIFNNIMTPLGLTHTNQTAELQQQQPGAFAVRSCGFDGAGGTFCGNFPPESPAGGLWSNGDEMLDWLANNMHWFSSPTDLKNAMVLAHSIQDDGHCNGYPTCTNPDADPGSNDYVGLGWEISYDATMGGNVISKAGDVTNFHAYIALTKDGQRGVFVLLNNDGGNSRDTIGTMLLHSLP